jgi:hypothetical protein
MELTPQEFKDLSELTTKPGWTVFQRLLKEEFDKTFKKLRGKGTGKEVSDKNLNFVNGKLDGIELAQNLADKEIANYEPPEDEKQE